MQTTFACLLRWPYRGSCEYQTTNHQQPKTTVAIFHLSVKTVSRSAGRSSTAAAAYRAGVEITDRQTGEVHDYRRKSGIESAELFLPAGAPKWATDRAELWNAAEKSETRKNSTVAREFEVALPDELSADQRQELAHEFTRALVKKYGFAADCAIHAPGKDGDSKNHHAHILCSTRKLTAEGFTAKTRELDDRATGAAQVVECRELFASMTNVALERAGHSTRVDHRSLEAQGIDRDAGVHLGPTATAIERRGEVSEKTMHHQERQAEAAGKVAALIAIAQAQAKAEQDADDERIRNETLSFLDSNVNATARTSAASRKSGASTDRACAFAVADHAGISQSLGAADANLGRAVEVARGRQHHRHAGAVAQALGRSLERLVPALATITSQVERHLVELANKARQAPAINPLSRYHPENIAKREAQEREMATQSERDLAAAATQRKAAQPSYRPTPAELKAVDEVLIDEARVRLGVPLSAPAIPIQPTREAVPPAPGPSLVDLVKASFAKFVEWISGNGGKCIEIDTQRSDHFGPVVQRDDLHAVQRTGPGKFAIHQLDRLDKLPALDDPKMEIKYRDGVGQVVGKLGQVVER
jgi:hypothetical protein